MTLVDKKYNEALDRMTGTERVQRTLDLFDFIFEMLQCQVLRECPGLTGRALRKAVAQRMYFADEGAMRLLDKVRVD